MPKISLLLVILFAFITVKAQTYEEDGEVHLLGPVDIRQIERKFPITNGLPIMPKNLYCLRETMTICAKN